MKARLEPLAAPVPPDPVFPEPESDGEAAPAPGTATVVVVEVALVVVVVDPVLPGADVAASVSSSPATCNPAVTMAAVAGAAPKLAISCCPLGPSTNRIRSASA